MVGLQSHQKLFISESSARRMHYLISNHSPAHKKSTRTLPPRLSPPLPYRTARQPNPVFSALNNYCYNLIHQLRPNYNTNYSQIFYYRKSKGKLTPQGNSTVIFALTPFQEEALGGAKMKGFDAESWGLGLGQGRLFGCFNANYNILPKWFNISMKATSNSRINREQQVEVVIRLKPDDPEARLPRCVYLSDRENELVVETENKKEIFVFDHIANQNSSQMDIYRMIGEQVVQTSFEGYNCCIFAYGQTGAGKTYSVMGSLIDVHSDYYSEHRGLLPRIIEDVFSERTSHTGEKCVISCSFMEVYNQQIFDLLSPEKRILQIRQDFKHGVFVEGLSERKMTSYKQAIDLILEGEKTRKMASTAMNSKSSRSHAIFTILIETEAMEGDTLKVRKSKLNIVDLAGSERVKHTHVMGEQLKEGCNINKSLHVLGNVINSLVESAKKKKHIPFRDSKLTHYLKDSLGGNSITKLLANIHTNKLFLGDTLSTLMFAKRAKSLKMKVEANENVTENFDALRKEVKRLREELAQAHYFKGETQRTERPSFSEDSEIIFQKLTENQNELSAKSETLRVFEENELHYKSLMEVYEEHLSTCGLLHQGNKAKQPLNMVSQWKNLEKKNVALANLVKRFPAFTKIFKENLLLKEQEKTSSTIDYSRDERDKTSYSQYQTQSLTNKSQIEGIIRHYEAIIDQMQTKFKLCLESLEANYAELQHECKLKDKRIKQFMRKHYFPPEVAQLKNENEYLQLNILNLQNQICQIQQNQHKLKLERNQQKKMSHRKSFVLESQQEEEGETLFLLEQLKLVKQSALKEMEEVELERQQTERIIDQLRKNINMLMVQNAKLQMKGRRSRSQKKSSRQIFQSRGSSSNLMKTSFTEIFLAEQSEIIEVSRKSQNEWEQEIKHLESLHKREIDSIRVQIAQKQSEVAALRQELSTNNNLYRLDNELGKDRQILCEVQGARKDQTQRLPFLIYNNL